MPDRGKTDPKPPHHPHDKGYRQLLTNKKTFLELLRTFAGESWATEIDEGDLTLVNKSYVLQDFSDKEADIVYRLRLRGTEVIFYVPGAAVYRGPRHALPPVAVHGGDMAGRIQ